MCVCFPCPEFTASGSVAVMVSYDSLLSPGFFCDVVQSYHLSFGLSSSPPSGTGTIPPPAEDELINYNFYVNRRYIISH